MAEIIMEKVAGEALEIAKNIVVEELKKVDISEAEAQTCKLMLSCFRCKSKQPVINAIQGLTTFTSQRLGKSMWRHTWIATCKTCGGAVRSFKKNPPKTVVEPAVQMEIVATKSNEIKE
jgi:hypothetical protein